MGERLKLVIRREEVVRTKGCRSGGKPKFDKETTPSQGAQMPIVQASPYIKQGR